MVSEHRGKRKERRSEGQPTKAMPLSTASKCPLIPKVPRTFQGPSRSELFS